LTLCVHALCDAEHRMSILLRTNQSCT